MNLFDEIRDRPPSEVVSILASSATVRIERIVSQGHSSPPDFWYDQDEHEWVCMLQGEARLRYEDEEVTMKPGDWQLIPAHRKHRVEWTAPGQTTIWLAVFYRE